MLVGDREKVLYLSYDGMLEPLGQSQVLPYLRGLGEKGWRFTLVSFEKAEHICGASDLIERMKSELVRAGIAWYPMIYHKRPTIAATLYDVICGVGLGVKLVLRSRCRIVHARSYVAGMMAWLIAWLTGVRFVFDMRGFWADERVDGGLWPRGGVYRVAKYCEKIFLCQADHIVSLTEAAKRMLMEEYNAEGRRLSISVIPTCVDTDRFRPCEPSRELIERYHLSGKIVFIYVGSVGTWYAMEDLMEFYSMAKRNMVNARFLLLVHGQLETLQAAVGRCGLTEETIVVADVPSAEVPRWLALAHVGVAFYGRGFSNIARFPTKIGEYLSSGIPVVVSGGVGDCTEFIEQEKIGISLKGYSQAEYVRAVTGVRDLLMDHDVGVRCRSAALRRLSLRDGVELYADVYARVMAANSYQKI